MISYIQKETLFRWVEKFEQSYSFFFIPPLSKTAIKIRLCKVVN